MTQKVGVANGAPAAKQKASFGKYMSIITLALVLPIAITFLLVGIISVKNNMLNSVEVSLPGTMAFVAQTLAEELESGNSGLDTQLRGLLDHMLQLVSLGQGHVDADLHSRF